MPTHGVNNGAPIIGPHGNGASMAQWSNGTLSRKQKGTNMKLKSKFAVGKYTCEMSYKPDEGRLDAEWLPDVPPAKSFSKKLMAQYRAGRDAFVRRIAAEIGLNVMLVEV
jgi:hypothetical protein